MSHTPTKESKLAQEYARIGLVKGDRLPTPASATTPEEVLDFMRRIPDATGRTGYLAALAESAGGPPRKAR